MRGAEGRAEDARPLQHVLVHELDQPLAGLVFDQAFVAIIDAEREEGAAGVIDPDEGAVGDEVQALDAAIIRVRPPADIREQAGRVAEPPLLRRLGRAGRAEQGIGPEAELIGAVERARAPAGNVAASRDQRIFALLVFAQQAVQQSFADTANRYDDGTRLHLLDEPLEHERAEGQRFAPGARDVADAGERALRLMIEQSGEPKRIFGADPVVMHDAQRIVGLRHVEPRERPPRPADGVEVAAPALLQPVDLGELGIDDVPRLLQAAFRCVDQAQAAERERRSVAEPAAPHVDQLETAAAEVAGKAVGRMDARYDAEPGEFRLPRPRQDGDGLAEDAFGLGDEFRSVGGLARGRRGYDLDAARPELIDEGAEAAQGAERAVHRLGREPPGRCQRPSEAAENLFVEDRRWRAARIFIDDEADRV